MQANLMLPDQGDLLLRWDEHLARERRKTKKGSRRGAGREVEEKPGQGGVPRPEGLWEQGDQGWPVKQNAPRRPEQGPAGGSLATRWVVCVGANCSEERKMRGCKGHHLLS